MEQGKFRKGFVVGMACTLLIGGGGLKVYDVLESNERNQGAVTDSFVQKAKYIEDTVKESYTGEVDETEMEEYMYKGMMASLGDPYSAYYTSEEYEELTTETTGSYEGIGVVMQQDAETGEVKVVRCYEGAPGAEAGLQPEDVLIQENLPYTVERIEDGHVFVVEGPKIERMLGYTNLESEKGFAFFQRFLKDAGILEDLEKAGIQEGDTVRMYGFDFDYYK